MSVYYSDDALTLHLGDSLEVLRTLDDGSVNCCVTSPPYFGLRDYGETGQYGLEATPAEYVETMRAVFAEVRRVLADDGTLWLNIGDSYSTPRRGSDKGWDKSRLSNPGRVQKMQFAAMREGRAPEFDRPTKSLLGIPWRVAFALQDEGFLLRSEVIWEKRNFMPESVTDRPTRSHEQVFLFTKAATYWYDADAIREESDPEQEAHNQKYAKEYEAHTERAGDTGQPGNVNSVGIHSRPGKGGRNARTVWRISTTPTPWAHFATFPVDLPERCIRAGCKPGGVVLDPFSGSGTTGLAAARHGRRYVGIDLNREYLDLSLRTRLGQTALLDGGVA